MAKKDSFLLSMEHKPIFDMLSNEEAGILIKAIYEYEDTGQVSSLEHSLRLAFIPIQSKLDKNRKAYEDKCRKNKENIKKRWEKYGRIPPNTNNTDNDYDNDYDSDVSNNNDYKEDDSCDDDPLKFYKININNGEELAPYEEKELQKYQQEIGNELLFYAMRIAMDNKCKNLAYVKAIVNNWKNLKITTLEQAEIENKKFTATKNKDSGKNIFEYTKSTFENLEGLYDN